MNDRPQVSWMAIEEDAQVFASDGQAVGKVKKVVGDPAADIFDGLAVSIETLGPDRFVGSERVRAIWPDRVDLDLTVDAIERLPPHEESPVVQWRAGNGLREGFRRLFGRR